MNESKGPRQAEAVDGAVVDPVVARIVDAWPPLTARQKARLAAILTGSKAS